MYKIVVNTVCPHNNLEAKDNYVGCEINLQDNTGAPDYIMYKRYECKDCGGIVTVLHAVIHKHILHREN